VDRSAPGEDDDARRVSDERLGYRKQRSDARLVRDRDENRPLDDLPDTGGCRRLDIERRILPQDRPLQLLERDARIDPEPVDERPAGVLVLVQRVRLPTRPVERRHQVPPQALAERVLRDECLELPDQLVMAPEREVGVDPELHRSQPDLLESRDGSLGEALVGEVDERRASPQGQRLAQPLRPVCRQAARQQASPLVHEAFEAVEIERVRLDPDGVAGRSGRQDVRG
jgi:hypothetical protein